MSATSSCEAVMGNTPKENVNKLDFDLEAGRKKFTCKIKVFLKNCCIRKRFPKDILFCTGSLSFNFR